METEVKKYEDLLRKSRTAYAAGAKPTVADVAAQRSLIKAKGKEESAEMELLKSQWYGDKKEKTGEQMKDEKGLIGAALHAVGTPFYGVTGTIAHALGRGTEKDLWGNIKKSIEEERTIGDLLRGYGMNNYAAMPLGFALDIAFDPLCWLTMGTSGLVGKTVKGALKKGVTGASMGAKARILEQAAWTAEKMPKKIMPAAKYEALLKKTKKAKSEYEHMAGDTIEEVLAKSENKKRAFDKISAYMEKSEFGQNINKFFGYFATRQLSASKAAEDFARKSGKTFKETAGEFKKEFSNLKENLFGGTIAKKGFQSAKAMDAEDVAYKLKQENKNAAAFADTIQGEIKNIKRLFKDNEDDLIRFTGMEKKEMKEIANTLRYYKIDVAGYDRKVAKTLLSDKNRKMLRAYGIFTGMFKTAKIGGNLLTAGTNAVVGNIAMTSMMGVNIVSPGFRHSMGDAINMMKSRDLKVLKPFLEDDAWVELIHKYPKTFESVFGINARAITDSRRFLDDFTDKLFKSGEYSAKDITGFRGAFDDAMKGISRERRIAPGMVATAHTAPGAAQTSLLSSEILRGPFTEFLEKLRKAKGNSVKDKIGKAYYKAATVSMEAYNKVDQTYRVGLSLHLTKNGISERELRLIARRVPLGMTDVKKVGDRFKINPIKAMDIAQETYMNYLAMPAFVQMMRTIPLVGFPFMCRSEDTEILTENGWKKYYEIKIGEKSLSLNVKSKKLEWKKIKNIFSYKINKKIISFQHRSVDILATDNHEVLVAKKEVGELPKVNGKRQRSHGDWIIEKVNAGELNDSSAKTSIVCGAENGYCGRKKKVISDDLVELFGWFITEGWYTFKKVNGEYSSFSISQSKPKGVKRLLSLRKRLKVNTNMYTRKKEDVKMANYDCYVFHFPAKYLKIFKHYNIDKKYLTVEFLNLLTKEQLKLLFDIMILADGHFDKKRKRKYFTQNDNQTLHNFQVLCLMLGYTSSITKKPDSRNCYNVTVNYKVYRQIKRNNAEYIDYKGVVWCPEVEDNNNWIARRNGKIDITGNSFAYGMATLSTKTTMYNPAFYNKVQFLLKEISGDKSPLEKEALDGEYFNWLNRPGMTKLPFFQDNPLYLNMANMIPHYTMNILQPSERDYKSRYGGAFANMIDKLPFFKSPDGQIALDYVILPSLLQEEPQGMFGQPLWEKDASMLKKAGYVARAGIESVMPPMAGLLGYGTIAGLPPEEMLPYIPIDRFRQQAFATKGKTRLGIKGKEAPLSRSARVSAAIAGWPIYPMSLEYQKYDKSKKKK